MSGHIRRRGRNSWRLKFDTGRDPKTGKRRVQFVTVRGTRKQAQSELTRLLAARDSGTMVAPSKLALAEYLRTWITTAETISIAPKTAERYRQLIERQISPHLGMIPMQEIKAAHIANWHAALLKVGSHKGLPLSSRTVGHAHRVLHKALRDAVKHELLLRNPAALVSPPTVTVDEMKTLGSDQVKVVLEAMIETPIYPQIAVLLLTGMRRGELMGLQWRDVDFDAKKVRIERSVEKTKAAGLRLKSPKTRHGRRLIALSDAGVDILREHRKAILERRLALGLGRLPDDAFVFGNYEGSVRDPDRITQDWKRFAAARGLPRVTLHALRHSHASALIASGTDPVIVSRRLGHASPIVTMSVYAHLFDRGDETAAKVMDSLFGAREK
jgi:integrase